MAAYCSGAVIAESVPYGPALGREQHLPDGACDFLTERSSQLVVVCQEESHTVRGEVLFIRARRVNEAYLPLGNLQASHLTPGPGRWGDLYPEGAGPIKNPLWCPQLWELRWRCVGLWWRHRLLHCCRL